MKYHLGRLPNGKPFYFPRSAFDTHTHLIGGTGKGKTTALHTMLHQLMLDPTYEPCVVIIDRMGGLSTDLLRWMASDFCTDDVRRRLIYIEPAREDVVMGFNPLVHESPGEAYYKVTRASEIVLKGWESQNIEQMPRLARWLFNSFFACALLGLTIADASHLVLPGSEYHKPLLAALPEQLQCEWNELLKTSPTEVSRILESSRNRLQPFFNAPALFQMFGATHNRFDMRRFMRERRIVLLNLWPGNRIPDQLADAIGGMAINEVLTTARSATLRERVPTFLYLDEFQRFVGPDLDAAIPETRQLGIKLVLSHQSLSQLERGDFDLRPMIFVAQSRMVFGLQGEDADLLAQEFASLHFDPYRLKEELYSSKQRIAGHKKILLDQWSNSESNAENWVRQFGQSWNRPEAYDFIRRAPSGSRGETESKSDGQSRTENYSHGSHEQMLPIHEDLRELMSRTYFAFDETCHEWGRDIRKLTRGEALIRLVDDPTSHRVNIKRSAPGYLGMAPEELAEDFPEIFDEVERLLEQNFRQDVFVSPAVIEGERRERLSRIFRPVSTASPLRSGPKAEQPTPFDT